MPVRLWLRFVRPILRALCVGFISAGAVSPVSANFVPVDGVELTQSSKFYDRRANVYYTINSIANRSSKPLSGPLRLVVENTTVPVVNGQGVTDAGESFFTVADSVTFTLAPGETTPGVRIDFARQRVALTYTLRLEGEAAPSDDQPPIVAIDSPIDGATVTAGSIDVSGTVDVDAVSVTANGIPASLSNGSFSVSGIPLVEGSNAVTAVATDAAGNTASDSIVVILDTTAPGIIIGTPFDAALLNASPVEVAGIVDDPQAAVSVNGITASVVGNDFTAAVPLVEGANTITAIATDSVGNTGSANIVVTLDTAAPALGITSPNDGAVVGTDTIDVVGTVDADVAAVTVNGISAAVSNGSYSASGIPLIEGSNTLTATATDVAGNSVSVSVEVIRSVAGLEISIGTPTDGALLSAFAVEVTGIVSDPAATVTVNGIAATVDNGTFSATVPLVEGENTLTATAADGAGNTSTTTILVIVDTAAPQVSITSPANGDTLITESVTVIGTVDDDTAIVGVNGLPADVSTGGFTVPDVPLTEGPNTLVATATDAAGNVGTASIDVNFVVSSAPAVTITEPQQGTLFSEAEVIVTGTVDDESATVTVNGIPAAVIPGTPGTFTTTQPVVLREGNNLLTSVATNVFGQAGTASIQVTLDTDPPTVTVETPRDGAVLTSLQVDVAGLVNDITTGTTINADDCQVTVNGVDAEVVNRSWIVPNLLMQRGRNTLNVVATDRAGNTSTTSVEVTVQDQAGQRIVLLSGNSQTEQVAEQLPDPLVVTLLDDAGSPVSNRAVTFQVSRGDGLLDAFPETNSRVIVNTDENGLASVLFTLGERTGAGNHRVLATATGFIGEVEFCAMANPGPPARITATSGDRQTGIAEKPLPESFVALVTDRFGNPVEGVDTNYTVIDGGGSFGGGQALTRTSDPDGLVSAILALGPQVGINNNIASVAFDVLQESPATFTATSRLPDAAAETTVSGVVLDNQDNPVEGVTITLAVPGMELDPVPTAITDDQGLFTVFDPPIGTTRLIADGSTTSRPGRWPAVEFDLIVTQGLDNTVGQPIWLLPLAENELRVPDGGPDQDQVLTMLGVPGAELTIFANSVDCPAGGSECSVTWTQVRGERVPMEPPLGSSFMLAWTLQPAGAHFDPPVAICIPNSDMAPGVQAEMFSFDHDLGDFVAIGTATVTDDGSQLCSDPGFGIVKSGWGGCAPPPPPCSSACSKTCSTTQQCKVAERTGDGCRACGCRIRNAPSGTSCNDSDGCTINDSCQSGSCSGDRIRIKSVTPQLSAPESCADDAVLFDVNVDADHCSSLRYAWSFGDGNTGNTKSPTHTYANPGVYTATVTVTCATCSTASKSASTTVTVYQVSAVDLIAKSSPLTTNSNAGGGLRIFPGRTSQTDSVARNTLQVRARLSSPVKDAKVFYKVFDLDDPSSDTSPLDANGNNGGDNRGSPATGSLSASSDVTDTSGSSTVDFSVPMQPGDNFRVAASCSSSQLNAISVDSTGLKDAAGSSLPSDQGAASDLLTVWRHVYVERDVMKRPTLAQNSVSGQITKVETINSTQTRVTIDQPLQDENQYVPGVLRDSAGNNFQVISNTNNLLPFLTPDSIVLSTPSTALPATGSFAMVDDDVDTLPSIIGDRAGVLHSVDLGLAKSAFAGAYVDVVEATSIGVSDDSDVPFVTNVDFDGLLDAVISALFGSIVDAAGAKRDLDSRDDFWSVVLTGCFQAGDQSDRDPNLENGVFGVAVVDSGVSCVFLEFHRDARPTLAAALAEERDTTAHELGHLFGGKHADGGLQNSDGTQTFTEKTLDSIRDTDNPGG